MFAQNLGSLRKFLVERRLFALAHVLLHYRTSRVDKNFLGSRGPRLNQRPIKSRANLPWQADD